MNDGICLTGIGIRFPAGIDSPQGLWSALASGRDAIGTVPLDRWDAAGHYDPDPSAPGKVTTRHGGFLSDVAGFDASFFDVSPREARQMDPQQRLALETAWAAFEDAGATPQRLREGRTGVFIGSMWAEYDLLLAQMPGEVSPYTATGNDSGMIAGRIAHAFGLRGPALTVNTASSSSLVAVHLALQSLQNGECDRALVGGSNLILTPYNTIKMTKLGTMAPDGRCKAFDHRANGYVRAEGIAFVLLERRSQAEERNARVYALVRGSAANNDGPASSLTAPSVDAQEELLRDAYARAGVSPHEVDYVEAHGTGTPLGDRTEAEALGRVLGSGRPPHARLRIGSIKTNFGHMEAAAGVAGLIKTALALHHGSIPASLHVETPNPDIAFDAFGLQIQTESSAWPNTGRPRCAGVSSFGFGGTNCHVVLEGAPHHAPRSVDAVRPTLPLLLSAKSEAALRAQAQRWANWLEEHPEAALRDVVHTAACLRAHHPVRAQVMAADGSEAAAALTALAKGEAHPALTEGEAKPRGRVVFVYPGQGSQWQAMGRKLFEESEAFAKAVRECDAALRPWTGWSVESVLRGEPDADVPPEDRVDVVQPALFAMAIGLTAAWRAWGIEPEAVVGHSQGEVVAAYVAGILPLEEAARVVAARSSLARRVAGQGAMALIELPVDVVEKRIADYAGALSVAVVNTANSTVVSGEAKAVDDLLIKAQEESIFARKIKVDYASHSAYVDSILPALRAELGHVRRSEGAITFYSTVTGKKERGDDLDAVYWCRNLREPVRLDWALARLQDDGYGVFVEVSAHPILGAALTEASRARGGIVSGSLQRDAGAEATLWKMLGALHVQGHPVHWAGALARWNGRPVDLPTYAFQRQRHWLDTDDTAAEQVLEASWLEKLALLPRPKREQPLLEWVRAEIAAVLGMPASQVAPEAPLRDLGMKSPGAVELASRLERRTGVPLSATFVYKYPNAGAVTRRLLEEMFAANEPSLPASGAIPANENGASRSGVHAMLDVAQDASTMSDEELFNSIDALVRFR
ncbi:type I polyketide synthase [Pendulispora brunnea]|uniref:Type I polyketide synthase n=1 Tax=Pendulispora brunnea TaxID=2905690 RepID=A0ABZ2JYE2_9BACT